MNNEKDKKEEQLKDLNKAKDAFDKSLEDFKELRKQLGLPTE